MLVIGLYGILWGKSKETKMAVTNVESQNDEGSLEKVQITEETDLGHR